MATTRPFAYNPPPNALIAGTEQVGDLAIGTPTSGFTNNPQFWNGPDEELGYVIAHPTPSGNQPNPLSIPAYLGFWRTDDFTDQSFINLSEYVSQYNGTPQTFTTGLQAKTWLNNNGFWTSYESSLLVSLDSGNPLSYSGSGSVWYDLSGYGNDATLVNSPTYSSDYTGILQFDNASLETANIPDLGNLPVWTIEAWVRFTTVPLSSFPNATSIIANEYNGAASLNFTMGTNNAPADYNVGIGFFDGAWHSTTGFVPEPNVWYQIVGTYDGATLRQYINGSASGGTLNYVGVPQSGGQTRLMRRWDATPTQGDYCDGDLAIVNIYSRVLTSGEILTSYNNTYSRFITAPTPTPTPSVTATPTGTPSSTVTPTPSITNTLTPTPSTTSSGVTGYSFNLVVLPYNYPSSGNTIMVDQAVPGIGTTNPNVFATNLNGIYFNTIDSNGVNRTNYFASFTGQSITLTLSQSGNTAIYSGDSKAFQSWSSGGDSGFTFGYGIAQPGYSAGTTVLIQSASTPFITGQTVTISAVVNGAGVTPTPTATSVTPTPTPTSGATGDGWLFYTPEGIIQGPPTSNGDTIFLSNGVSTFNPNFTGTPINIFFNVNNNVGTSYLTQFQQLDTNGGTITMSQGGSTAIYSGSSTDYTLNPPYISFNVNSPTQMIQSASTAFVSGTTINLVVS